MNRASRVAIMIAGSVFALAAVREGWTLADQTNADARASQQGLIFAFMTLATIAFAFNYLSHREDHGVDANGATPTFRSELRLVAAIDSQERSGRMFLLIGTALAMSGVVLVVWRPIKADATELWLALMREFGPILIVEAFALQFLRLFRTARANAQYYQNELTNLDARSVAVRLVEEVIKDSGAMTGAERSELIASMVRGLLATERNRLLEKGQSSIGMQEAGPDRRTLDKALEALQALASREAARR